MPAFKGKGDLFGMEIAGVGVAMIVVSVLLLVWAFPRLPQRQ
jgi:hypothetical protein